MSIIFIYITHHIILALGLASSLIIDIFIIIVEKTRKIRGIEKNIMKRIMSYSFLSSLFLFLIHIIYFAYIYLNAYNYEIKLYIVSAISLIISTLLLFCTASQKYYQFKILERYQEKHEHLSDSFIIHHKELKQTSIIIFILWLCLYITFISI